MKSGRWIKVLPLLHKRFGLVGFAQGTQALKTVHRMNCSSLALASIMLNIESATVARVTGGSLRIAH